MANRAFALMSACLLAVLSLPIEAAYAASDWALVQSFPKSAEVHSATFFSATRGFAVVGNRLLATSDAGGRWTVSTPAEWTSRIPRDLSFADAMHGWAVGDGFILATTDGGIRWTLQAAENTPARTSWRVVRALGGERAVAASADGVLALTTDAGATWRVAREAAGERYGAIAFADAAHGFAAGTDASGGALMLGTADGGATWTALPTPATSGFTSVTFVDAAHGWATTPDAVVRTDDGGSTWRAVHSPAGAQLPADGAPVAATHIALVSPTHAFLSATGLAIVWETADGGATWRSHQLTAEKGGVFGLVALDASHVLAMGSSLPTGEQLTSSRIWSWRGSAVFSAGAGNASAVSRRTLARVRARRRTHRVTGRRS